MERAARSSTTSPNRSPAIVVPLSSAAKLPGKSFVHVGRYKNYAKHLITRVNTINGRKYSEDDTHLRCANPVAMKRPVRVYACVAADCALLAQ